MLNTRGIADTVARWSVIALAALVPVFVIPVSWASVPQGKMLLLGSLVTVALIAWAIVRISEGSLFIPRSPLFFAGLFLPVAYVVSALASGAASVSFVDGLVSQDTVTTILLLYAVMALSALVFPRGSDAGTHMLRAVTLGGALVVLFQTAHLFFPDTLSLGGALPGRASSIFGSWHDLGIFLGLLLFLSVVARQTSLAPGVFSRVVYGGLGVGSFLLLVVVNSADVWIALAILFALTTLYLWFSSQGPVLRPSKLSLRRSAPYAGLAALAAALALWGGSLYPMLPERVQVIQLEVRPSWQGTFAIGEKVFAGGSTLLFGSGPNTFTREWGLFKPPDINATDFWNADFTAGIGVIPTSFVTVGAFGALAWLTLGATLVAGTVALVRRRIFSGIGSDVRVLCCGAGLYLLAFHVVHVPGPALGVLTFLMLGICVFAESSDTEDGRMSLSLSTDSNAGVIRMIAFAIGIGLLAVTAVQVIRAVVSDTLVGKAVAAYSASGELEDARLLVGRALAVFSNNDRAHRAAIEVGLLQLRALATQDASDEESQSRLRDTLERTIAHGLSAVAINDSNYQNWLALANLYENLAGAGIPGAYENARSAYEKANQKNPTNPLPLVRLAQLNAAQGEQNVALVNLNAALGLKPNFAPALFLRSHIHAAAGRFKEAREDAGQAVRVAPEDPLGWYNLGIILYGERSYGDAAVALEQAVTLQDNYANALFVLALSYEGLGKRDLAIRALQRVLALNPENDTVPGMIRNIERGLPALPQGPTRR